jgi:hypothetical protein
MYGVVISDSDGRFVGLGVWEGSVGVDDTEELGDVIRTRSSRWITIGSASSTDEKATRCESSSKSRSKGIGVVEIEGSRLWAANGLGTGSKRSSLSDRSIEVKDAINSSRRVGRRSVRNELEEGSMI